MEGSEYCKVCGKPLQVEVKRVGREFAIFSGCCNLQDYQIVHGPVEHSHEAEDELRRLRQGRFNRRGGERRRA